MSKTYQDFEKSLKSMSVAKFLSSAIDDHRASELYKVALIADSYDKQKNKTMMDFVQKIYSMDGMQMVDFTASNNKICSNFFHRLNSQRCSYSLGNGISFVDASGDTTITNNTKEKLGADIDHHIYKAAYKALIHGVSFIFWNKDRVHIFPITEFVPLYDEETGALRAGIRFWRIDKTKPLNVVFYESDGYTKYRSVKSDTTELKEVEKKRAYILKYQYTPADGLEITDGENYPVLPIVPMWGSDKHQSTLVGMRGAIDSYDLIKSGFANDLQDVAQIYWIVNGAGGMSDEDLSQFRDRIKFNKIASIDDDGVSVQPYTQSIPSESREKYLDKTRSDLYEDFAALDVHTVAAGATNDHIDMAYQSKDEEAAEFEYEVAQAIKHLLSLQGIDDEPVFSRNRISNQMEQTQMVVMESQWLDPETILHKLPNIKEDEIPQIMARIAEMQMEQFSGGNEGETEGADVDEM